MLSAPTPRYRLHSPDLLRTLMQRTGNGSRLTVRALAAAVGCHASYISELMTGAQETANAERAQAIAQRIGVDLLILWTPTERADSAIQAERMNATTASVA